MRRQDKEITELIDIQAIIKEADVCRLAFAHNNVPYLVPLSFGYNGKCIYIHTAQEGRKIDFIKANNRVCFEFETAVKTVQHPTIACKWTSAYKSVIGYGRIIELTDFQDIKYAINEIMLHYSGKEWDFTPSMLKKVKLWKIEIENLSGKQSGF